MDCSYPLRKGLKTDKSKSPRKSAWAWRLRATFRSWDGRHNVTSSMSNHELHKNLRTYFDPPTLTQLPGLRRSGSANFESLKGARRRPSRPDDLGSNLNLSAREPKLSARSYLNSSRDGSARLDSSRSNMNSARESAPML